MVYKFKMSKEGARAMNNGTCYQTSLIYKTNDSSRLRHAPDITKNINCPFFNTQSKEKQFNNEICTYSGTDH